ncbi:MAG: carbamoyltransferase HypF [Candidatus Omnitrophica bacterium]|nr:carbamoyltransferase HypF [Candidatus Omnitrophota bacterium]
MNRAIVALGADMKNQILSAKGKDIDFGPQIGDLSQADNFELFKKQVHRAIKKISPRVIAYDMHPHYFSSLFARSYQPSAFSLQPIQHHHAHIASVLQEHRLTRPVIGVCFDGTGYGVDGNSWGGEFLLVDGARFRRLGFLKYRKMPGGDKVVHQPWRMAVSILGKKAFAFLKDVPGKDKEYILRMLTKDINSPQTSSAGRLFDAAAAILGLCQYASYEAQGPIELEKICDKNIEAFYPFVIDKNKDVYVVDTDRIFLEMCRDIKAGKNKGVIAAKFHNSMVEIVSAMAKKTLSSLKIKDIALSGGVFQNNFLKEKMIRRLSKGGFNALTNIDLPANDLNISLGQYYVSCCSGKNKRS